MTRSPANMTAGMPKPRLTARGMGVAAACWLLCALLYASAITAGEAAPFVGALIGQVMSAAVLAALSVPAWLLVVQRMDRARWGWKAAAHMLIAPLYAFLGAEAALWITRWGAGPAVAAEVGRQYVWILSSYVVLYALQFALYHAARFAGRLRRKEQEAAELLALARERELAALKAQVNPHFLFNALNSVSAAAGRDPEAARAMLEDLAGLLRYAMGRRDGDAIPSSNGPSDDSSSGSSDDALVTLEDELAFARRYLALEGRRFGARLDARFDVDETTLPARLPPMTLQPLIENAVRHGIAPLEEGGTVTVRASRANGRVRVTVEDTGAGLNSALPAGDAVPPGGTGLENTSARLQRHFDPDARLRIAPNDPRGFRVWFSIPAVREMVRATRS